VHFAGLFLSSTLKMHGPKNKKILAEAYKIIRKVRGLSLSRNPILRFYSVFAGKFRDSTSH